MNAFDQPPAIPANFATVLLARDAYHDAYRNALHDLGRMPDGWRDWLTTAGRMLAARLGGTALSSDQLCDTAWRAFRQAMRNYAAYEPDELARKIHLGSLLVRRTGTNWAEKLSGDSVPSFTWEQVGLNPLTLLPERE